MVHEPAWMQTVRVRLAATLALCAAMVACAEDPAETPDTVAGDVATDLGAVELPGDVSEGGCQVASDCPGALDLCLGKACVPRTACQSDKQCSDFGHVCDATTGVCVLCLTDTDCNDSQKCLAQTCVDPPNACENSKACPSGQVCDKSQSLCVGCVLDADCDLYQNCQQTVCKPDLCHGGAATCLDVGTRKACVANGAAWTVESCGLGASCQEGVCGATACVAGKKACAAAGNAVVTCSADGKAWADPLACPVDSTCKGGACEKHVCSPGAKKCNADGGMEVCAADGLSAMTWFCPAVPGGVAQSCIVESGGGAVCEVAAVCAAGANKCVGEKVATCRADGTGWDEVGCDDGNACTVGDSCADGACKPGAPKTCLKGQTCAAGVCAGEPEGMAPVPAGTFNMGCVPGDSACDGNEKPRHEVYLDLYYMDVYEVTVARYEACVKASKCSVPPSGAPHFNWGLAGREQYPVNQVTWDQAAAFCNWAGARLPTEAEWEKAARGALDGKIYPWGDLPPTCTPGQENSAVWNEPSLGKYGCGTDATWAVGAGSAKNGYGLYDMAGNVWEWVSDWYGESYYGATPTANPQGPAGGSFHVVRGGSYAKLGPQGLRASYRYDHGILASYYPFGFRCAWSPPCTSDAACNDGNACTADSCNVKTGVCEHSPAAVGTGCDADGDACTVGDSCQAGVCKAGAAKVCGSGETCVAGACVANKAKSVSAGQFHSCLVDSLGGVQCWGHNYYGQTGTENPAKNLLQPTATVGLAAGVKAVRLGDSHTCALTLAGGVKCW